MSRFGRCGLSPTSETYFQSLVASIIGQQLSKKAATTIRNRVWSLLGSPAEIQPRCFLGVSIDDLRLAGVSGAKAKYVLDLANTVSSNEAFFDGLDSLEDYQVTQYLTQLNGVGIWTAQMFLIFSLGRLDVCASSDVGLRRGLKILLKRDYDIGEDEFEQLTRKWSPYRSIASWYLWRLLD
jgi:DNA-3-methyladenine glycosylase II